MGRATLTVLAALCIIGGTYAMECSLSGSDNFIEKFTKTCPRPLIDSSDQSYCCIDLNNESYYCCNAEEFALKTGLGIIVPAIIAVVVIISLVVLCISCLCCTCCPWYRRRHRGTVYGNLHTPPLDVIHVIQPSQAHNGYPVGVGVGQQMQGNHLPAYASAVSATTTPQYSAPPPRYVQEGYVKQAPFNPSYVQ